MASGVLAPRIDQMHRFVSHLQVLAGLLCDTTASSVSALLDRFERLADDIPENNRRVEQVAVNSLLKDALERLCRVCHHERDLSIAGDLDRRKFRELIKDLGAASTSQRARHISHFHETLRCRYKEPDLSVGTVATAIGLSRSHLMRLLILHTGRSWKWHLHGERINQAKALLQQTTLTVKEISGRVGYLRTNQLDRHFRDRAGMTPSNYRNRGILVSRPDVLIREPAVEFGKRAENGFTDPHSLRQST